MYVCISIQKIDWRLRRLARFGCTFPFPGHPWHRLNQGKPWKALSRHRLNQGKPWKTIVFCDFLFCIVSCSLFPVFALFVFCSCHNCLRFSFPVPCFLFHVAYVSCFPFCVAPSKKLFFKKWYFRGGAIENDHFLKIDYFRGRHLGKCHFSKSDIFLNFVLSKLSVSSDRENDTIWRYHGSPMFWNHLHTC